MSDVVNLRQARKAKKRSAAQEQATVNRLRHGTPKVQRALASREKDRAAETIAAHKLDER